MPEEFDSVAEIYDDIFRPHIRDYYIKMRTEYIVRHFKNRKKILDIGCGTGLLVLNLKNAGYDVYGIDISKKMVEIAAKRMPGRIVCSSAERMPFLSESFDGVVCVATMHHIRGKLLKSVMHEISRVLKPNGRVVIWDHNRINPYWLFLMKRVPQDQGKEQIHSSGHLIQLLEDAGIKTIVYEKKGFMPDFIPIFLMRLFSFLERGIEKIPLLNLICSHNVIIGEKNVER